MSKGIYIGKLTDIPVYETELVNMPWSFDNFDSFFHTSISENIRYTANGDYVKFAITQGTITQQITLTALYDLTNVTIQYYYRSTFAGKITITINGVSQKVSTSSSILSLNPVNLSAGDTINVALSTTGISSSYNPYFQIKCDNISIENKVITGYEQKEVARKVKKLYGSVDDIARRIVKGYIGINGVARLFYGASPFDYTGDYTESEIEIDGTSYTLYELTSSGTLKCGDVLFWMCGAGAGGGGSFRYTSTDNPATESSAWAGRGGASGITTTGNLTGGTWTVLIGGGGVGGTGGIAEETYSSTTLSQTHGSDGGLTSISSSDTSYSANGGLFSEIGGSGGGASGYVQGRNSPIASSFYATATLGNGISTLPFSNSNFTLHASGGKGGDAHIRLSGASSSTKYIIGGKGGTNGGNGSATTTGTSSTVTINGDGANGVTYGDGGNGGDCRAEDYNDIHGNGGSGYQGVVYILAPA